jgi:hypothetical protein
VYQCDNWPKGLDTGPEACHTKSMKETKAMTTKNTPDLTFDLAWNIAMEVFGAPYHYLPWNEKLACRIVAAFVLVRCRLFR